MSACGEIERGSGCGGERGSFDDGKERKTTTTVRKACQLVYVMIYLLFLFCNTLKFACVRFEKHKKHAF